MAAEHKSQIPPNHCLTQIQIPRIARHEQGFIQLCTFSLTLSRDQNENTWTTYSLRSRGNEAKSEFDSVVIKLFFRLLKIKSAFFNRLFMCGDTNFLCECNYRKIHINMIKEICKHWLLCIEQNDDRRHHVLEAKNKRNCMDHHMTSNTATRHNFMTCDVIAMLWRDFVRWRQEWQAPCDILTTRNVNGAGTELHPTLFTYYIYNYILGDISRCHSFTHVKREKENGLNL